MTSPIGVFHVTSAHNDGFRSRVNKKSRTVRGRRSRWTRIEQLEDRRLLAGLGGDIAEGEFAATHQIDDHTHSDLKYLPPQYVASGRDGFVSGPRSGAPLTVAMNYLRQNAGDFGLTTADLNNYVVKSQYKTAHNGVTHIALRQTHNGLEVLNSDITVNVAADGRIISAASSFVPGLTSLSQPVAATLDARGAYSSFASEFNLSFSSTPAVIDFEGGLSSKTVLSSGGVADREVVAEMVYVPVDSNGRPGVELAWNLNVPMVSDGHWYSVSLSADDGENLGYVDWVWNASYNALPIPVESPFEGGRTILIDPADPLASPYGWHDVNGRPGAEFFDTRGNNVDAREDRPGNFLTTGAPLPTIRPSGGASLDFDSVFNDTLAPVTYTDAAVTNLFVWVNLNHDVLYQYGFDEPSGNFQSINYTGSGEAGDPVLALSQLGDDLAALNNAFMATPPDGQQPTIGMFTFDTDLSDILSGNFPQYNPRRDGSFEAGIITHEFGHGVTNRLTGGPANANALGALQSGGMGEGWSDFFSLWFTQREEDMANDAYPQGTYVMGPNPQSDTGIRRFAYSFDMSINPLTFQDFNGGGAPIPNDEVHNSGEIWAQALWDMNFLLVEKYGFDSDLYNGTGGNNLAMQLVIDGLKLQPVNPSFLDGRDAILAADLLMNDGVNHKEIWEAFARRGMGFSADDDITGLLGSNSNQVSATFDLPPNPTFVSGTVWGDSNGDGAFNGVEQGIPNWEVFIDLDGDGVRNDFEPSVFTDANGDYSFELYAPATLTIAQVLEPGTSQTFPSGNGTQTVDIIPGQDVMDVDFGVREGDLLSTGSKFHDLDGDGQKDAGEPGVAGFWIYVDYDDDGRLDLGEPAAITQADGSYNLSVDRIGTFKVREVNMAGWVQTMPGGTTQAHEFTVEQRGSLNVMFDFGNRRAADFGDAPDSYRTTDAAGGPSHGFLADFSLGATVDVESNGVPSANADGDDLNQVVNDEDGVTFTNTPFPGGTADFDVEVSTGANSAGRLNAWIDFNGNGVFDASERVVAGTRLTEGTHSFSVPVPATAVPGITYARFRYGFESNLGPGGSSSAGEVEDYTVQILSDTPDAVDDTFQLEVGSVANTLLVLANDVPSRNAPIFITDVSDPSAGGRVVISAAGDFLTYTPAENFVGVETFTYTISDQAGATDTAQVTINLVGPLLFAVDDSFAVPTSSTSNILTVLSNDLSGENPPVQIVDVSPSPNGTITIDRRGTPNDFSDDVLRYTPNPGFNGTDQFSYTIQDSAATPQQDSATVTVHVGSQPTPNDEVRFRLQAADVSGNPISSIAVGDSFQLQVFVTDLRSDDGDGDATDRRGVAGAYLDLLYDLQRVSVTGNIQFAPDYQNVTTGNTSIPGLIDEAGAFQTSDQPLGAGELLLLSVPMRANAAGEATFRGDPADSVPFSDTLLFEPPRPVAIDDQFFTNSNTTGLVESLQIIGGGSLPVAIDNTFSVSSNSVGNPLEVLANDFDTSNPPLQVVAVGAASNGTAMVAGGGQRVSYTPQGGFSGTDQFTYTIRNSVGLTATATVTVQVGNPTRDVNFRLATTDASGTPISQVAAGSQFELRVFVQDLRSNDGDGDNLDERGVFAAYLDLLYDSGLASVVSDAGNRFGFDIEFGPQYNTNGLSASASVLNIIDEAGAFQSSSVPLGSGEFLLATVTFEADAAGTVRFQADPADISPLHDSLLFEPTDPVALDQINFGSTTITIVGGGEGELVATNPANRFDVDGNDQVTPRDVLLVVNAVNALASSGAGGEGEGSLIFLDVNGDRAVTPMDALQVVNYLNNWGYGPGQGEGEGAAEGESSLLGNGGPVILGPPLASVPPSLPLVALEPDVGATSSDADAAAVDTRNSAAVTQHDALFAAWDAESADDSVADDDLPLLTASVFAADDVLTLLGSE